jgi:DNA polymerase-1
VAFTNVLKRKMIMTKEDIYLGGNAINVPIQGSATDIIKVAMERIYERLQKDNKKSKMILQVRDELNFNVVPDELEYMKKMVVEEVENAAKQAN